ncbi:MAG: choice-of-anchor N protein [Thermodesulfovibrionia bacterium]|nr:choice-of-anchor N protein [Thermodesulfovibrionia bacterium]
MKKLITFILILGMAATTYAVPTLQVGAPAGAGDSGAYADYQSNLINPTETDTARTSGNTIFVAGAFGPKDLFIGGQYTDPLDLSTTPTITPGTQGFDWTDFSDGKTPFPSDFAGRGAILLASVPDGSSGSLTIDLGYGNISPFYISDDMSFFPNEHDPVKAEISDFLFFDIGSFAEIEVVPDFCESGEGCGSSGSGRGQIKTVKFQLTGYDWVHFDAMALVTYAQSGGKSTRVVTTLNTDLDNNPGSHDVTWEDDGGGGGQVPEPGTILLLGSGLIGLALYGRKKFNKKI